MAETTRAEQRLVTLMLPYDLVQRAQAALNERGQQEYQKLHPRFGATPEYIQQWVDAHALDRAMAERQAADEATGKEEAATP
jgi:hypothetical protein